MIYLVKDIESYDNELLAFAIKNLPDIRRKKAQRYARERDRFNCAVAYHLVKFAVKQEYNKSIYLDFGNEDINLKPFIQEAPDIHFSISHSRSGVVCYIASHAVGIDIEEDESFVSIVPSQILSKEEYMDYLTAPNKLRYLCRAWTMKEAIVKCHGAGLNDQILTETICRKKQGSVFQSSYGTISTVEKNSFCITGCSTSETDTCLSVNQVPFPALFL